MDSGVLRLEVLFVMDVGLEVGHHAGVVLADHLVEGDGALRSGGAEGGVHDVAGGTGLATGFKVLPDGLDEDAGPAEGLKGRVTERCWPSWAPTSM